MLQRKKIRQTKKNKIEFSKIMLTSAIIIFSSIAVWSMIEYYRLVKIAIETQSSIAPDPSITVTCITTILGAILSYCLYQAQLKSSLNKNKLTVDQITGEVKSIITSNVLDNSCEYNNNNPTKDDDKPVG